MRLGISRTGISEAVSTDKAKFSFSRLLSWLIILYKNWEVNTCRTDKSCDIEVFLSYQKIIQVWDTTQFCNLTLIFNVSKLKLRQAVIQMLLSLKKKLFIYKNAVEAHYQRYS